MRLVWDKVSRDFYRSRGSRFDVFLTHRGDWLAVDAEGGMCRGREFGMVRLWCENRAANTRAA